MALECADCCFGQACQRRARPEQRVAACGLTSTPEAAGSLGGSIRSCHLPRALGSMEIKDLGNVVCCHWDELYERAGWSCQCRRGRLSRTRARQRPAALAQRHPSGAGAPGLHSHGLGDWLSTYSPSVHDRRTPPPALHVGRTPLFGLGKFIAWYSRSGLTPQSWQDTDRRGWF